MTWTIGDTRSAIANVRPNGVAGCTNAISTPYNTTRSTPPSSLNHAGRGHEVSQQSSSRRIPVTSLPQSSGVSAVQNAPPHTPNATPSAYPHSNNANSSSSAPVPQPGVRPHVNRPAQKTTPPHYWISRWLSVWSLMPFIGVTIGAQVAIVWLAITSTKEHGVLSVTDTSRPVYSFDVGNGLLWTFLPSLIFQTYAFIFAAIVAAACRREPFVELVKPGNEGAAPEKSLLLDYSVWIPPHRVIKAVKYGHLHLAFAVTICSCAQSLGPLGSHLFDTATFARNDTFSVTQSHTFDQNAFDARSDMGFVLDLTIADEVYHARQSPWTTPTESLLPFTVDASSTSGQIVNITTNTPYYSFNPDCRQLSPDEYSLVESGESAAWYLSVDDRDCVYGGVHKALFASKLDGVITYFMQTYTASCDESAGRSRIILAAATDVSGSSKTFDEVAVVSCIPAYNAGNGTVRLTYTDVAAVAPISFTPTGPSKSIHPVFARNFEIQLSQPTVSDPTRTELATRLGDVIWKYARLQNATHYMTGDIMANATTTILQTAFNLAVQSYIVQPTSDTTQLSLHVEREVNRLYVILPIACTIEDILLFVWTVAMWLLIYTRKTATAQHEDGVGLLAGAVICDNEDLLAVIARENRITKDGEVYEKLKHDLTGELRKGFQMTTGTKPQGSRLQATRKARPVRWFRS